MQFWPLKRLRKQNNSISTWNQSPCQKASTFYQSPPNALTSGRAAETTAGCGRGQPYHGAFPNSKTPKVSTALRRQAHQPPMGAGAASPLFKENQPATAVAQTQRSTTLSKPRPAQLLCVCDCERCPCSCSALRPCQGGRRGDQEGISRRLVAMALLTDLINLDLSDCTEKIIAEYIW